MRSLDRSLLLCNAIRRRMRGRLRLGIGSWSSGRFAPYRSNEQPRRLRSRPRAPPFAARHAGRLCGFPAGARRGRSGRAPLDGRAALPVDPRCRHADPRGGRAPCPDRAGGEGVAAGGARKRDGRRGTPARQSAGISIWRFRCCRFKAPTICPEASSRSAAPSSRMACSWGRCSAARP